MDTPPVTEQEFLDFKCPYCGRTISFPTTDIGEIRECPTCTEALIVPEPGAAFAAKIPIPISTPRLLLRKPDSEDAPALLELLTDGTALHELGWEPWDIEQVEQFILREKVVRFPQNDTKMYLSIDLVEKSTVIGLAYLSLSEDRKLADLAIVLRSSFRRQGFGTEGIRGLLELSFQGLRVHRVSVDCDINNQPARATLAKAGLRFEGESLKNRFVQGAWRSSAYYAMLEEEFGAKPPQKTGQKS
ncbi:MAG TPA: GNAT family protein [Verrucomicrobiae bacterium]|jgi:RimJ/RimL family protein N-acetyltransferase